MGFLSWLFDPAPLTAEPAPTAHQRPPQEARDTPEQLRAHNTQVVAAINRSAGSIPNAAVVLGRAITDVIARILEHPHELGIDTRVSLYAVLTDYIPTTLRTYLSASRNGLGDEDELQEQMTLLHTTAGEMLDAIQHHDAQAAAVQGQFLRTKFTRSDLDL